MTYFLLALMATGILWLNSRRKLSIIFLLSCVTVFFVFFFTSFPFGTNIYSIVTYQKTIAEVVDVRTREKYDAHGDKYLMYQPIYSFNNNIKDINFTSEYFTTKEFFMGDTIRIAFKKNDYIELIEEFYVFLFFKFLMILISSLILIILYLWAVNKEIKEIAFRLFSRFIMGAILIGILIAVINKFILFFRDEEEIEAIGIVMLIFFSMVIIFSLYVIYSKNRFNEENGVNAKKSKKKKSISSIKEKYYQKKDTNDMGFYAWIFASTIVSSIAIALYIDEGINPISIIFGIVGLLTCYLSIQYFLGNRYFKRYSLHLTSPIQTRKKLIGRIEIRKNIDKKINFNLTLKNTIKVSFVNDEGEEDYRIETVWKIIEEKVVVARNKGIWEIPFHFQMKEFREGELIIVLSVKVRFFTLSREFILDKRK